MGFGGISINLISYELLIIVRKCLLMKMTMKCTNEIYTIFSPEQNVLEIIYCDCNK